MKNKLLKKVNLALEIIQKKRKKEPGEETFRFLPEEFTDFPLLHDITGLSRILGRIEKGTKRNVWIMTQEESYLEDDVLKVKVKIPFKILINIEDFDEFDQYRKKVKERLKQIKDTDKPIFIIKEGLILFEGKKCKIPHDTKQYDLCKIMFSKAINERVSWDEIANVWKGYSIGLYKGKDQIKKEEWREVYDSVNAVNRKVKQKLQIERLFQYKDKSVIKLK